MQLSRRCHRVSRPPEDFARSYNVKDLKTNTGLLGQLQNGAEIRVSYAASTLDPTT